MPAFSTIPTATLLVAATRLFTGLRDNDEIAQDLKPFGHTPETAAEGLALVGALRAAMRVQGTEGVEAAIAARASTDATEALRTAYTVHRARARRAHPRGSAGYAALALAGSPPDAEAALFRDARSFYQTLQDTPDLAGPIRNLPAQTIEDALALVVAAETAEDQQTDEAGQAQRASALRTAIEADLRATASLLAADADDALAPKPQLREIFGLLERGT